MLRQPLKYSSAAVSAGYDPENQELEIEFNSGDVYVYRDVPGYVYDELLSAKSTGKYISDNIRNRYQFTKA
jgi:hypothetical protein